MPNHTHQMLLINNYSGGGVQNKNFTLTVDATKGNPTKIYMKGKMRICDEYHGCREINHSTLEVYEILFKPQLSTDET